MYANHLFLLFQTRVYGNFALRVYMFYYMSCIFLDINKKIRCEYNMALNDSS